MAVSASQHMNVNNKNLLSVQNYNLRNYTANKNINTYNKQYSTEILDLSKLDLISETNKINAQMLVPYNMLHPPPHKTTPEIVNHNNETWKKMPQSNGNNGLNRPYSPKEYDDSDKGGNPSIQYSNNLTHEGLYFKNGMIGQQVCRNLSEQYFTFGKFSNSSPNVYYHPNEHHQHQPPTNLFKTNNRHYSNSNNRPKYTHRNTEECITRRVYGLMERFKSRAFLMKIDPQPERLLNNGPWDQLNQAIWDVFMSKAQKEGTYIRKLEAWRSIFLNIKKYLHSYGLFIVGSTMSGFGLESSDIDICLLTKPFITDPRIDALQHLDHVRGLLIKCGFTEEAELIVAKVPILKFKDSDTGFEVDLNCNNGVGIKNTHLLHCYGRLDWRVRPLVVIVKLWAQANNINDAKNMTISSYSLSLMVINYLQCGITPSVLPCLHALAPDVFHSFDSANTDVQEDINLLKDFKSDNTNCLGDLLIGFLNYYSYFNYAEFAISVRTGSRLPIDDCRFVKAPKNDVNQWKYLCIEEPFNYSNTARSVFDIEKFKFIREVFLHSYRELAKNKVLSSILPVQLSC